MLGSRGTGGDAAGARHAITFLAHAITLLAHAITLLAHAITLLSATLWRSWNFRSRPDLTLTLPEERSEGASRTGADAPALAPLLGEAQHTTTISFASQFGEVHGGPRAPARGLRRDLRRGPVPSPPGLCMLGGARGAARLSQMAFTDPAALGVCTAIAGGPPATRPGGLCPPGASRLRQARPASGRGLPRPPAWRAARRVRGGLGQNPRRTRWCRAMASSWCASPLRRKTWRAFRHFLPRRELGARSFLASRITSRLELMVKTWRRRYWARVIFIVLGLPLGCVLQKAVRVAIGDLVGEDLDLVDRQSVEGEAQGDLLPRIPGAVVFFGRDDGVAGRIDGRTVPRR